MFNIHVINANMYLGYSYSVGGCEFYLLAVLGGVLMVCRVGFCFVVFRVCVVWRIFVGFCVCLFWGLCFWLVWFGLVCFYVCILYCIFI